MKLSHIDIDLQQSIFFIWDNMEFFFIKHRKVSQFQALEKQTFSRMFAPAKKGMWQVVITF